MSSFSFEDMPKGNTGEMLYAEGWNKEKPMNNKTIPVPIELAERFVRTVEPDTVEDTIKLRDFLRSALSLSDRELFLVCMKGEYEPKRDGEHNYVIDADGSIHSWWAHAHYTESDYARMRVRGKSFAPTKELAETLRSVILGDYLPNQIDINDETPFWIFERGSKESSNIGVPVMRTYPDDYAYFFTKEQRDNFALQQEEKREEQEQEESFFVTIDGFIDYGIAENNRHSSASSATIKLNSMLTELARLTKLHPEE